MDNLLENLKSLLGQIRLVLGGGSLNSASGNYQALIEFSSGLEDIKIPGINQDRLNLRLDRNNVSKAYSKAFREKKLELGTK